MPLGIRPTIVGGMAVYFWTEGDAFATYDIDVVMAVPEKLAETLAQLGLVRSKDGRHWELPGTEVLLEAPSAHLDADAQVAVVTLPSGRTARVLSRVDILLDRLDEFQATGHQLVAQQALVLLAELTAAEQADLDARAPERRLTAVVAAMRRLARRAARNRPRGAACRVLSKTVMKPQTIKYEEWRRDAPRRRAQTERILAMLGPIRRDRPRHPTEAAFLRRIGTPERLIGPDA